LIQINAQMRVSTPRTASKNPLIGSLKSAVGMTLRAARNPRGSAKTAPINVPRSAIASVSPSALK
jgi:hypothetical protein